MNNEQRNKMRKELENSIKNEYSSSMRNTNTQSHANNISRSQARNFNNDSDDYTRLSTFSKQYEPTRKLYYEMSMVCSGLQNKYISLRNTWNSITYKTTLGFASFVAGVILLALLDFGTGMALLGIPIVGTAFILITIFMYNNHYDKLLKKIRRRITNTTEKICQSYQDCIW